METNEALKKEILEIVDNQLRANDPPETKQTLERLIKLGYSRQDAKIMIAQCIAVEIFDVLKSGKPYDEERYVKNLHKLPEEPFDD